MQLSGKLALVTGASRGIGAATAKALAQKGSKVILVARTAEALDKVAKEISENGGEAHVFAANLADHNEIVRVAAEIRDQLGTPDILVNNAGLGRWLFVHETPHEEVEMMIRLPYLAAFQITREFLGEMIARGAGHIVNVNSPAALMPWGGATGYVASRWALRGMAESLKTDLRGTGVNISHVVLGEVSSNYWEANPGARKRLPAVAKVIPTMSTEQAAQCIITAIRRNRKEFTRPVILLIFRWFLWLTPWLVRWVMRSGSYREK